MQYFCLLGPVEDCGMNSEGVSSQSIIPDGLMKANSQYNDSYKPSYGRLNGTRGDGWCSRNAHGNNDWLEVDLGRTVQVCAVETQGDISGSKWTTAFKLSFYLRSWWTTYKNANGEEVVRCGWFCLKNNNQKNKQTNKQTKTR